MDDFLVLLVKHAPEHEILTVPELRCFVMRRGYARETHYDLASCASQGRRREEEEKALWHCNSWA